MPPTLHAIQNRLNHIVLSPGSLLADNPKVFGFEGLITMKVPIEVTENGIVTNLANIGRRGTFDNFVEHDQRTESFQ
jgi:hypothetical protein